MNLYFCETCGKRVTDEDILHREAYDKQAKGVFCKACAAGVNTEQFDPIPVAELAPPIAPAPPAPPVPPPPSNSTATGLRIVRQTKPRKAVSRELEQPAAPRTRSAAPGAAAPSNTPLYAGVAAIAVTVLGALALMSGSGAPAASKPEPTRSAANTAKPQPEIPAAPAAAPSTAPASATTPASADVMRLSADRNSTEAARPPVQSNPAQAAARALQERAGAAFDSMRKAVSKIDPKKIDEQSALIEAYLKEFGDADEAPRARVMLSNLRKPPEPAAVASPAPPSATPAPDAAAETGQAGRELFNKKDLSGWEINGACHFENGEMVFDGDKKVSAIFPSPGKDYTLILEILLEDGSGSYVEVSTRNGTTYLDRSMCGEWMTVQITTKGNKLDATMLKGKGHALQSDISERPDYFRIHTMNGGKKHVRSVRIVTNSP